MKKTIAILCLLLCCLAGCRTDTPEQPPETLWATQETETAVPVPSKNNVPLKTADQVEVPVSEFDVFVLREIQPYDPEQESLDDMRYLIPLPSGNWMCAETDSVVYDKNMDYQYIPKMYGYIDKGGYFKLPYDPYGRDQWYQTLILEMTDGTSICKLDKRAEGYGTFINGVKVNDDYIRIVPEIGEMIYEDYYIGAKVGCAYLTQAATCGLWDAHTVKYALYHEYEKLTEAKYLEIFRTEGAFVAVYKTEEELFMTDILDDNGEILRTEEGDTSGQYPKIPYVTYKSYEVCQDTETGLYYYTKEDGQPLCEPMFTHCTRISEAGTAIVKYEEKLCVLELKAVEVGQITDASVSISGETDVEWLQLPSGTTDTTNTDHAVEISYADWAEKDVIEETFADLPAQYRVTFDDLELIVEGNLQEYSYRLKKIYCGNRVYTVPDEIYLAQGWVLYERTDEFTCIGFLSPSGSYGKEMQTYWIVTDCENVWIHIGNPYTDGYELRFYVEDGIMQYRIMNKDFLCIHCFDDLKREYQNAYQFYVERGIVQNGSDGIELVQKVYMTVEDWFHSDSFLSENMRKIRDRNKIPSLEAFIEGEYQFE